MIKGVILDIDGTLLDSMSAWDDVGARYLRTLGVQPEERLTEILFAMSIEEGARYMKEHYGLDQSVEEIIRGVIGVVRDFYYYEVQMKPGVREFLEDMQRRQIPVVAATASEADHIVHAFRRLEILPFFERIFTCQEAGASKREPKIYHLAADYLALRYGLQFPEDYGSLYVFEDVLYAIRTANAVGFHTVGIYDRYSENETEDIKREADDYMRDFTCYQKLI